MEITTRCPLCQFEYGWDGETCKHRKPVVQTNSETTKPDFFDWLWNASKPRWVVGLACIGPILFAVVGSGLSWIIQPESRDFYSFLCFAILPVGLGCLPLLVRSLFSTSPEKWPESSRIAFAVLIAAPLMFN